MHEWPVCDMTNPDLQRHWKDPCTFKHFPLAHMPFFSHSLWSTNEHFSISVQTRKKNEMTGLRLIPVVSPITLWRIHTYTTFSVGSQIVARRTRAYETSRSVVTLSVVADPLLCAFVHVCSGVKMKQKTKGKVRWKFNTISDDMSVRAGTSVLFTHKMTSLHTLVTPRVCSS